jgi:hypothetical protein
LGSHLGGGGGGGGGFGIVKELSPFFVEMAGLSGSEPKSDLVFGLLQPHAATKQMNPVNNGRFHEGMKVSTGG